MAERRPEPTGSASRHRETARRVEEDPKRTVDHPEPTRTERLAVGTETGVRRVVQTAAVLLWIPFGFVFWLPFLLRRTVAYVFAVLYAGLVGGDTDRAERRWEQAVAFYQLGFRRILHAFRPEEVAEPAGAAEREPEDGPRRLLLEFAWAVVIWVAILWLTGLWPDAPEALRSAALRTWEMVAGVGQQIDAWAQGLLRR